MKTKQNKTSFTGFNSLILSASLALLVNAPFVIAGGVGNIGNQDIIPPQAKYRGLTYSDWTAEWFRYTFSLPIYNHPLFDTADCSTGQADDVWFIGGRMQGGPAIRDCTIPPGTALFLSLASSSSDNEGCAGDVIQKTNFTEAQLRSFAHDNFIHGILGKKNRIIIDGQEVEGMPTNCNSTTPALCESPYQVQAVFDYTSPAFDSILIPINGECYIDPNNNGQPYTVTGAAAEGVYVMIKPLSAGKHTILFGPPDSVTGLPRSRYNITVSKQGNKQGNKPEKRSFN